MHNLGGNYAVEGSIVDRRGVRPGYIIVEGGAVVETGEGECPVRPDIHGMIVSDIVNGHTHCADYALKIPSGMSLEELVAPPNGLKHRYLQEASEEEIRKSMRSFSEYSASHGAERFVDFREGGVNGCRMLRQESEDAIVLGRPLSPEFDPEEVEELLDIADGIGVSSISDMDYGYIEELADAARDRGKVFAIHASERVREDIDFVLSLDPAFVVHMCEATDSDISKCAEAEVPIVFCPTSNAYFGKVPPIARAEALGADLALGTDNGMLCAPDMVAEAAVFAKVMERQGGPPSAAWNALTRLSGKLLNVHSGIQDTIGRGRLTVLETGPDGAPLPTTAGAVLRPRKRLKRL